MNKYITYVISLTFSLLALSSCADRNEATGGDGFMSLSMATSSETIPGTKATKAADPLYKVDIVKSSGETVGSYPDHTQLPATIKLTAGPYTVKATAGNPLEIGYDKPVFYGEAKTTINVGKQSAVSITAQLNNVVFSLQLEDKIQNGFNKADLIISDAEGGEIFTITKENLGKLAYLPVKKSYKWKLNMVNKQGSPYSLNGEITDAVMRNRFDFTFKINETAENQGLLKLDIKIDRDLLEFDHILGVTLNDDPAPEVAYEGNFVGGQTIMVNELSRGKQVRYNITAKAGIKEMWLYHQIEAFDKAGIPRAVKLTHIDATMRANLSAQGVEFSPILYDEIAAYIDFSTFCNNAPLGTYTLRFTLEDQAAGYLTEPLLVMVMPDQDHMALSADAWAKFATIKAEWYTLDQPAGLTIEYRKESDVDWIKVASENLTFDVENKAYSAKIKDLEPSTKYLYRSYSDVKAGAEYTFTTEEATVIPNLDYQSWAFGNSSGGLMGRYDTWYPNTSATNYGSFWSTGNEGTSMTQAGKCNITYPVEDETLGKKVVKMESIWINATFAKTFAAGNLYSGYFAVNTGNPIMSAKLGRPYQGRPLGLKGKYKYISKKINRNAGDASFNQYLNKDDKGIIYIKLENWGNPNIKPEDFGSGNQPSGVTRVPIAYGEVKIDDTKGEWVEFTFKLDYSNTIIKPTHITFASSSSIYGENFCGAEGSTLWVSDFELIWSE